MTFHPINIPEGTASSPFAHSGTDVLEEVSGICNNEFNGRAFTDPPAVKETWSCSYCTFDNQSMHLACGACGEIKNPHSAGNERVANEHQDSSANFDLDPVLERLRKERHEELMELQRMVLNGAEASRRNRITSHATVASEASQPVTEISFPPKCPTTPCTTHSSTASVCATISSMSCSTTSSNSSGGSSTRDLSPSESPLHPMRPAESAAFGQVTEEEATEMRKILAMTKPTAASQESSPGSPRLIGSAVQSNHTGSSPQNEQHSKAPVEQMRPAESAVFGLVGDEEAKEMRKILSMNMLTGRTSASIQERVANPDAHSSTHQMRPAESAVFGMVGDEEAREMRNILSMNVLAGRMSASIEETGANADSHSPSHHMRPAESAVFGQVGDEEAREMRKILSMNFFCSGMSYGRPTFTVETTPRNASPNHCGKSGRTGSEKPRVQQLRPAVSTVFSEVSDEDYREMVRILSGASPSSTLTAATDAMSCSAASDLSTECQSVRDYARRRSSIASYRSENDLDCSGETRQPWELAEEEMMAHKRAIGTLKTIEAPSMRSRDTHPRARLHSACSITSRSLLEDNEEELVSSKRASLHVFQNHSYDNDDDDDDIDNSQGNSSISAEYLSSFISDTHIATGRRHSHMDVRPGSHIPNTRAGRRHSHQNNRRPVSSLWVRAMQRAQSVDLEEDVLEKIAARSRDTVTDLPAFTKRVSSTVRPGAYHKMPGEGLVRNRSLAWAKKRGCYTTILQQGQAPIQEDSPQEFESNSMKAPDTPTVSASKTSAAGEEKLQRNETTVQASPPPSSCCTRGISGVTLDGEMLAMIANRWGPEDDSDDENLQDQMDEEEQEEEEVVGVEKDTSDATWDETEFTAEDPTLIEERRLESVVEDASSIMKKTMKKRSSLKQTVKSLKNRLSFRRNK